MSDENVKKLPKFNLPVVTSDGETEIDQKSLLGQPVVLYCYPKDNTPGCTTEACDFRDNWQRVTAAGAKVYGISPDSAKKHVNFIEKHQLPFPLIVDEDKELLNALGAWGEKRNYGKVYMGVIRSTFLFDAKGKLIEAWRNVRVKGHVDKVLSVLEDAVS